MTDADNVRAEIDRLLSDTGTAMAILNSFEHVIEGMKTTATLLGFESSDTHVANSVATALSRTMMEISTINARLQRLQPGLEEWRNTL